MKIIYCFVFIVIMVCSGCAAQKSDPVQLPAVPAAPAPVSSPAPVKEYVIERPKPEPNPDYQSYLNAYKDQSPVFLEIVKSNNPTASITGFAAAPAAPSGSVQPFSNLHTVQMRISQSTTVNGESGTIEIVAPEDEYEAEKKSPETGNGTEPK